MISTPEEPWLSRSFLKDAKLRAVERYYCRLHQKQHQQQQNEHHQHQQQQQNENQHLQRQHRNQQQLSSVSPSATSFVARIIPDAISWRKYLRWIQTIVTDCNGMDEHGKDSRSIPLFQWVLTESCVELMDHRNQSLHEATTIPQERSVIQQLLLSQSQRPCSQRLVVPLTDLSMRLSMDDEWDLMHMADMDLNERSRHALIRAASLLRDSSTGDTGTRTTNDTTPYWLLVDTLDGVYNLDDEDNTRYVTMDDILDQMAAAAAVATTLDASSSNATSTLGQHEEHHLERLIALRQACDNDYQQRNATTAQSNLATSTPSNDEIIDTTNEQLVRDMLRAGTLVRGRLTMSKENGREAFVTSTTGTTGGSQSFFVDARNQNRAFHEDIVLIQPLPEAQWGRPVGRRRLVHHDTVASTDDLEENDDNDNLEPTIPAVPSGRVVSIVQPGRRVFVATLIDIPHHADDSTVLVVPMNVRIPKIRLRTRTWRRLVGQRITVEISTWDEGSVYPLGHCLEVIGPIGDLEVEVKALLIENQVALAPFSAAALACLPVQSTAWTVTEDEIRQRRDLRESRRVFSVDPPGCQDIDDTMHAEILPNGDIEVGVHIADVTHFVEHNSQLDKEAQVRGTTFYLVDRRFDMLPELLSSNLCSLHEKVDRLAVSAIWTLSSDMDVVRSTWYGRTVIRNCAAMTYDQADNILHEKPPDDKTKPLPPPLTAGSPVDVRLISRLKKDLTVLTQLARKRRRDREVFGGAVNLSGTESGSELKFTLENGIPTKVVPKQEKEIHHTIAELMIMANCDVARLIHQTFPDSALLRAHRPVDESHLDDLRAALDSAGVELIGTDGASLAKSLQAAQRESETKSGNQPFQSLILSMATRAMTEAQYICTGEVTDDSSLSHYGLGLNEYTHFTSPIRRYCDMIVHKQLLAALSLTTTTRSIYAPKPTLMQVEPLKLLPDSEEISILYGEGLGGASSHVDPGDRLVDSLNESAASLTIGSQSQSASVFYAQKPSLTSMKPYNRSDVVAICEGLNLHNRLAKQSSKECQSLFLSLYFKDHADYTQAIVTNLRENGFVAYVPRYDFKGPVYLRDTNGDVQIDPTLLGLPSDFGSVSTLGFANVGNYRRVSNASCALIEGDDERLEVKVTGRSERLVIRAFEVVHVAISCENWDVRARVPTPRIHLSPKPTANTGKSQPNRSRVGTTLVPKDQTPTGTEMRTPMKQAKGESSDATNELSLYTAFRHFRRKDTTPSTQRTFSHIPEGASRTEVVKGRLVFGDFTNPDTRSAAQAAAQLAAAAEALERRSNLLEASSKRSTFDTSVSIERTVTTRQQRLASDKRNTRRSKAS